jgi:two-component system sensor histidine kinase TctE
MRRLDAWPLERRLLVGLVGALLLLALGLFFMLAGYARRASDRAYDQLLLASALTVADAVQVVDGQITVDLPYASLAILGAGGRNRVFYRVTAPDGALITGYPGLADRLPPARSQEPRFADVAYRDAELRAATLGRFIALDGRGSWVTIVIAHTRDESSALAAEILANAFLPVILIVVAAGGLLWFGIRRALAPLAAIEGAIRAREPTDLSPITAPAPVEVQQLLATLNHFMRRLQATLDLMQGFLADAAHQIRTPLATLRAQAELAVDEDDPASLRSYVYKIHRNAALASQVTNQLLSHTMVAHRSQQAPRQAVDLVPLLQQVVHHVELGGNGPPIELDLRELDGPATLKGDPITLREAFTNLLDNARKYAGDQYPVQIRVRRKTEDQRLQIELADRGPGIPDAEKERVLERFVRGQAGGRQVAGSGLGLAIVKAVVDAHGATITLCDRPGGGLVVRLDFPASLAEERCAAASTAAAVGVVLLVAAAIRPATAAEALFYPAPAAEQGRLLIHAATDRAAMEPLLRDFQSANPGTAVDYVDLSTNELFESVVAPADGIAPDLAISSAMDLQAKLVNDGWTQPYVSEQTSRVPAWANWRNEAFGFTLEPAVIVYRQDLLATREVPRSRADLIRLLQAQPDRFRRRVATYDIARSGVGYLFATHDSVLSSQFWRLALALGEVGTRLVPSSADILSAIESGDVLIGYNVLGSYARGRQLAGAPIGVVLPTDYTLAMARVAVIPRAARHLALAKAFLDHLLSARGQAAVADIPGFQSVTMMSANPTEAGWPLAEMRGPLHPITLGLPLLVHLDPLKKSRFLANWDVTVHPP